MTRKNLNRREQQALDAAQDIVWDAFDAETRERRLELARRAAAISPYCADALVILAEEAESGSDRELELIERAVSVGEAALGENFDEMQGEFWGFLETRPYMRARHALAQALQARGRADEAIGHLQAMIELNPNDNQGIRYLLLGHLVDAGRRGDIDKLTIAYADEDMCMWVWPLVLHAFKVAGDGSESRHALAVARDANKHVQKYLIGEKKLPKSLPDYYGLGDTKEAVLYVAEFADSWRKTPGAIEWLRANSPSLGAHRSGRPA